MMDERRQREEEARIAAELRALPDPPADPGYRERLRAAFVSGTIASGEGAPERRVPRVRPRVRWAAAALAAAVVLVIAAGIVDRAPRLRLLALNGAEAIVIDGQEVSAHDTGALDARLRPGAEVRVPTGAVLDLVAERTAAIEIVGGSTFTLPALPGRWFARSRPGRLDAGEIRFRSGARFEGGRLAVHTPDGLAEITGTLLSVQCDESGTCVCVLEGTVRVGKTPATLEVVTPGNRMVIPREGEPFFSPAAPPHAAGVEDFDARIREHLR
ncbi:MAG: FecR domain-containing protein [Candidatus Krumholzibacteria bacterium]|nr:FecR domain-containing protein [Candidatus Krumholzibacteria bacterium]